MSFHEHTLWQNSYVALMEAHDIFDALNDGESEEIVEPILESATTLTARIADGLTRQDKRLGRDIIMNAVGMVAIVRTHLAVAWGRGLVDDEVFRALDGKYDALGIALQQARI